MHFCIYSIPQPLGHHPKPFYNLNEIVVLFPSANFENLCNFLQRLVLFDEDRLCVKLSEASLAYFQHHLTFMVRSFETLSSRIKRQVITFNLLFRVFMIWKSSILCYP